MNEKIAYAVSTILIIFLLVCVVSCTAPWWTGHDNGEAYEAYTEAMEEYRREG